jgi:uncharacterized protein (AIM24 family)
MKKLIVNVETGETFEVDLTPEEIAQREADALKFAEAEAEIETKRSNALAKLAALGLDTDDLKALGL